MNREEKRESEWGRGGGKTLASLHLFVLLAVFSCLFGREVDLKKKTVKWKTRWKRHSPFSSASLPGYFSLSLQLAAGELSVMTAVSGRTSKGRPANEKFHQRRTTGSISESTFGIMLIIFTPQNSTLPTAIGWRGHNPLRSRLPIGRYSRYFIIRRALIGRGLSEVARHWLHALLHWHRLFGSDSGGKVDWGQWKRGLFGLGGSG